MKNDWREAKKRHKMQQNQVQMGVDSPTTLPSKSEQGNSNNAYDKDMDAMRCILYLHGGTVIAPLIHNSFLCHFCFRRLLFRKC